MNILESFNIAFTSLKSNKIRTFLTLLGIIIGVMAIILLISVITGTRAKVESEIVSLGSNVFMVFPGNYDFTSGPPSTFVVNKLKLRHLDLLEARSSYGARTCPEYDLMGMLVKYKKESRKSTLVMGVYANMPEIYNWKLRIGNFFKQDDVVLARKVAVIGEILVKDFFPGSSPVGKYVTIKGTKFRITGVLETKGKMFDFDFDDIVCLPITTAHNLSGSTEIHQITLKVPDPNDVSKAVSETKRILSMEMDHKDFTVASQGEVLSMFNTFANVLSIVTGCIAAISLLVGGIGIMNIMFVSVTERTKEIGIRKAVGANFYDISSQFIVEAIIIAVLGGISGILLSLIIITIVAPYLPFPLKASTTSILLAFGFSCLTGIFFGTYPALKAAKTDPIVALHFE